MSIDFRERGRRGEREGGGKREKEREREGDQCERNIDKLLLVPAQSGIVPATFWLKNVIIF